ncbi:MAG: hypothetical protein HC810_05470, partial [Acaryochloridaceae cyanobacterium RL_2_7]|nr:hypothetical protein [Acaryochloridaceae cyanobacterium RL_2_7]
MGQSGFCSATKRLFSFACRRSTGDRCRCGFCDSCRRELSFADRAFSDSGEYGGTMCLTEAGAGSAVGDLTSTAQRTDAGHYLITGSKIFISAGDHDL